MDPSFFGKRGEVLALLLFSFLFVALTGCGGAPPKAAYAESPAGNAAYPQEAGGDVLKAEAGGMANDSAPPVRTVARETKTADDSPDIFGLFRGGKADAKKAQAGAPPPPPAGPTGAAPPAPPPKSDPTQQAAQQRELIIYTARVTMAVYQVEQGVASVEKIANESGGYLANKQDRGITIRVPRARFQDSLAKIDRIGDVLHRDIQAQDVTDEHLDLEIRIKNARAMRARLQDLLAKANVKEALEIEKELHRVTEELERLEGKLKLLADKIAYSTITVAFQPRGATIRAASVRLPFPWLTQVGLPGLLQLSEEK